MRNSANAVIRSSHPVALIMTSKPNKVTHMTSAASIIDLTATTAKKSKSNFSAVLVYHFLSFLITDYGKSMLTQTAKTVPSEKALSKCDTLGFLSKFSKTCENPLFEIQGQLIATKYSLFERKLIRFISTSLVLHFNCSNVARKYLVPISYLAPDL